MQDLKPGGVTSISGGDFMGYTALLDPQAIRLNGKKNRVVTLVRKKNPVVTLGRKNHASLLLGRKTAWFFQLGAKLSKSATSGTPSIIACDMVCFCVKIGPKLWILS
jgi:hypothetical protein